MSDSDRPVVAVLEGISAGRYFADAALKRGLEPVIIFPKIETSDVYKVMRQSAVDFWTKRVAESLSLKMTRKRQCSELSKVSIRSPLSAAANWGFLGLIF